MTLTEAFIRYDQEMVALGKSLKTRKNYRCTLNSVVECCGDMPVELMTFDVIARWQLKMNSMGFQSSTVKTYLHKLRVVFSFLRKQGHNVIDSRDIDMPKVKQKPPTWLQSEEVEQLLSVIDSPRDKAIIASLFATGARISELLQLNRDSIKNGQAQIIGKGDKVGTLFFDQASLELIEDYLSTRKDSLTPLFISGQYRRITVSRIEQLLHIYSDMAGIEKNVTPHVLRHSFASDLRLNGADIYDVSKLLRHRTITTTMMYTHISDQNNQKNYQKYHSRIKRNKA